MRYKSSKAVAAKIRSKIGPYMRLRENNAKLVDRNGLHRNIDGSLDMRYKSSRKFVAAQRELALEMWNPIFDPPFEAEGDTAEEYVEQGAYAEEAVEICLYDIVSINMLNVIMANVPQQAIDGKAMESIYEAYNHESNWLVLTKEEAEERHEQEKRIIAAMDAENLNQKILSAKDANLAKGIWNTIKSGTYPEIVVRQALMRFTSLYDENRKAIACA